MFKLFLTLLVALGLFAGAVTSASAHPGQWDARHHYYHDRAGYWDGHDHYNRYVYYHHHRGYWGPSGVFINID